MKRKIDFSIYSAIKIGQEADVEIIEDKSFDYKNFTIIGKSNNIILLPSHPPLAMLSKKFSYILIKENKLYVGGATPAAKLFSFCKKNNIKNFEFLRSLPGSIGAIVKMNAGMKDEEIFNHLIKIDLGKKYINKENINYSYRFTDIKGVIFEAVFDLKYGFDQNKEISFSKMRKSQPKEPSAGSCFKNPENDYAGRVIEEVGLKGHKIGNICFSRKHANFLVNLGGATAKEAIELINLAKTKVKEKFNINLELELILIGKL